MSDIVVKRDGASGESSDEEKNETEIHDYSHPERVGHGNGCSPITNFDCSSMEASIT